MKLKIKHIQQPQQAHRIEVPAAEASLAAVKSSVSAVLSFGEGVAASEVALSLNKKDAIQGDDSSSLSSLGICSGDLLWVLAPPLLAAAPAPTPTPTPPAAAAAAGEASGGGSAPTAMEVDDRHQHQQQGDPETAAAAGEDMDPHSGLNALQELASGPSRPWIPDSLATLLTAAAAAASTQPQQQPHQQPSEQHMVLSPAQVLLLTAHAALLECGFVACTPTPAAGLAGPPAAAAAAAAAGGMQPGGSSTPSSDQQEGQLLQQLLRGPAGIYSVSYSLPAATPAAAAAGTGDNGQGVQAVTVELRGVDMGQHLVLVGALTHPAPAAAGGSATAVGGPGNSSRASRMVATLSLPKAQVTAPVETDAAAAEAAGAPQQPPASHPQPHPQEQQQQQQPQQQQQQQHVLAGYPVCGFQDLPQLWVSLKDGLGLPLLMAACAAAGLAAPLGLNSLTYDLQEAVLSLLEAKDLAALCCSCTPMRHRAATDPLWRPLFDREFPLPPDQQQEQQAAKDAAKQTQQPQQQQQQQQPGPPAGASSGGNAGGSSSSSTQQQPQQQQPEQQQPLHARLQYLLGHGQRYSLRVSLGQLRQEAGRRGWKWAFGAAWTQRARLLAEAERSRRLGPMPLHMPPHPSPMPWGPLRPRQPMMPPNIIGGDYDRFPSLGGFGSGFGMPGGGGGGLGFSGGAINLPGLGLSGGGGGGGGGAGGVGLGSGGALFSSGGGALGAAGPMPAGGGGFGAGGPPALPGFGSGRRGGGNSHGRLY